MNGALLEVEDLRTYFPVRRGVFSQVREYVRAVDGVSFAVRRGEIVGMVGESGCGKTTTGRSVLRLIEPTSGAVRFDGTDVLRLNGASLRRLRRDMQIVFQDPMSSLNPRMRIVHIVGEQLTVHGVARGSELKDRVAALLERVGLDGSDMHRFPHEFSGGQRQRIGIARAIALRPRFVVCDEPVSALDVSVQAQILNLLTDLRDETGLSYLFIAHNLAVVRSFCDSVAVMYLGKIVESGPADDVYGNPRHPYTQALLAAVPEPDPKKRGSWPVLKGEVPSAVHPPSGCAFHPRCPFASDRCKAEEPILMSRSTQSAGHVVACHHAEDDLNFAGAMSASVTGGVSTPNLRDRR